MVSLLGYCVEKRKRVVAYEYMPNRSLQESLFSDRGLNWERRFGDVKPSNVLFDTEFRAKLSDFGLSKLKLEPEEFGVDLFSQDLSGTLAGGGTGESPAIGTPVDSITANEMLSHLGLLLGALDSYFDHAGVRTDMCLLLRNVSARPSVSLLLLFCLEAIEDPISVPLKRLILGYAYPAFECFKTIEKHGAGNAELRFWCQYW
ncbi:hypothetical protein SSX86_019550 [Deinandra increscens subsp. villosa]|uniref:Protein kinase domain-containing protein n=1 Tax=Deinandra increscens subsp. villosa TaxID=3103831 RepID=A0AAP0D010_9ASTR